MAGVGQSQSGLVVRAKYFVLCFRKSIEPISKIERCLSEGIRSFTTGASYKIRQLSESDHPHSWKPKTISQFEKAYYENTNENIKLG